MSHATTESTAPPRITALPFVYTAPVFLFGAGVLLANWGALALTTPWSSLTLSLTHVGTLGVLSMIALGVFQPLVAIAGGGHLPWPKTTHLVYYTLVLGVVCLSFGTARAQAAPVFAAIGFVGTMAVVFIAHSVVALRRARVRGETVGGARVALWSFFLVASLGVWLAHGHGGMLFPGPRALWLQVHLSVGLLGWLGGVLAALSWELIPEKLGGRPVAARAARLVGRAIVVGVTLPVVILLVQYFGSLDEYENTLVVLATLAGLPAVLAVWVVHPILLWQATTDAADLAVVRFFRIGVGCGVLAGLVGAGALFGSEARLGLLFGWLALYGWAATCLYGVMIRVVPDLLLPGTAAAFDEDDARGLKRAGLAVHCATLASGAIAIWLAHDLAARATGLLVCVDAVVLMALVVRTSGPRTLRMRAEGRREAIA